MTVENNGGLENGQWFHRRSSYVFFTPSAICTFNSPPPLTLNYSSFKIKKAQWDPSPIKPKPNYKRIIYIFTVRKLPRETPWSSAQNRSDLCVDWRRFFCHYCSLELLRFAIRLSVLGSEIWRLLLSFRILGFKCFILWYLDFFTCIIYLLNCMIIFNFISSDIHPGSHKS